MRISDRAMSIELLAKSLTESVTTYEEVKSSKPNGYICGGYEVSRHDSKSSINRQITLLRSELLELSKEL